MEVWQDNREVKMDVCTARMGDKIGNFSFPLSTPLLEFNPLNSITVQSRKIVGNLTLSYGNLTSDPPSCSSLDNQTSSTPAYTQQGA